MGKVFGEQQPRLPGIRAFLIELPFAEKHRVAPKPAAPASLRSAGSAPMKKFRQGPPRLQAFTGAPEVAMIVAADIQIYTELQASGQAQLHFFAKPAPPLPRVTLLGRRERLLQGHMPWAENIYKSSGSSQKRGARRLLFFGDGAGADGKPRGPCPQRKCQTNRFPKE